MDDLIENKLKELFCLRRVLENSFEQILLYLVQQLEAHPSLLSFFPEK